MSHGTFTRKAPASRKSVIFRAIPTDFLSLKSVKRLDQLLNYSHMYTAQSKVFFTFAQ